MTVTPQEIVRRWDNLKKLLNDNDCLPVLIALRKKSKNPKYLQEQLSLTSAQSEKTLKLLRGGLWIIAHTKAGAKNKILIEYQLGKRGEKLLELLGLD